MIGFPRIPVVMPRRRSMLCAADINYINYTNDVNKTHIGQYLVLTSRFDFFQRLSAYI